MAHVQVHRFRDAVAIYVGKGETVYISASDARKFANAVDAAARSVELETFTESSCGTFSADFADARGVKES